MDLIKRRKKTGLLALFFVGAHAGDVAGCAGKVGVDVGGVKEVDSVGFEGGQGGGGYEGGEGAVVDDCSGILWRRRGM